MLEFLNKEMKMYNFFEDILSYDISNDITIKNITDLHKVTLYKNKKYKDNLDKIYEKIF